MTDQTTTIPKGWKMTTLSEVVDLIIDHRGLTPKKLGENLRKLRLKNDMSQGDLATALNVDRAYISNIENGRMNPTLSTLEKIANALGISSSELLK